MKRAIAILLALLMVLSLAACGSGVSTANMPAPTEIAENTPDPVDAETPAESEPEPEPEPEPTYSLGDTVSTDIVEFTLNSAQFSYYAIDDTPLYMPVDYSMSNHCIPLAELNEEGDGKVFSTYRGRCLVCMTYTITNLDRATLRWGVEDILLSCHRFSPSIKYEEEEYRIARYASAVKDGLLDGYIGDAAISFDNGKTFKGELYRGISVLPNETIVIRTLGIVGLEPNNIEDGFEMIVNLPTTSDDEYFTYVIE